MILIHQRLIFSDVHSLIKKTMKIKKVGLLKESFRFPKVNLVIKSGKIIRRKLCVEEILSLSILWRGKNLFRVSNLKRSLTILSKHNIIIAQITVMQKFISQEIFSNKCRATLSSPRKRVWAEEHRLTCESYFISKEKTCSRVIWKFSLKKNLKSSKITLRDS